MAKTKKRIKTPIKVGAGPRVGLKEQPVPISPLLWAILGLALLIKVVYLAFSKTGPFYEPLLLDPAYYYQWALKVAKGDFIGEGVFYGLPLYPFFLGLFCKIFNAAIFPLKAIQIILGLVTVFFIYKIGEKLASPKAGLLAALIAACYGPLFFHEQILIAEALAMPLYAVSFYLVCLFVEAPTLKRGAVLGVFFGLAALTKAGIILFVFLFAALLLIRRIRLKEGRSSPVFACVAAFLLVLSPVTAHNVIYGKDTVLLTSHAGLNFYIGNNPKAEGVFIAPEGMGTNVESLKEDSKALAEKESGKNLKPSEVSKYWSDKAWDFIKQNPVEFFKLCLRKFALFFDAREISDVEDYVFARNFNPFLKFPWLNFAVVGPLFFLGIAASFKSLKHRQLVWLWIISYLAGTVTFFINARYRLPLLSIFIPMAAVGALGLYEALRGRLWKRSFLYGVILLAGVGLTQARLVGNSWSKDYVNAGDAYQEKKDYGKAVELYKKALEVDPQSYKADLGMGLALNKLKRYDEVKDYYLKSLAINPDNSYAHNSLGLWYDREGELEEAKRCFLKAIELRPQSSQAHNNLGMVYGKLGENEKAVEEFEISLKLNPNSARACTNFGLVAYRLGNIDQAKELWTRALRIDPAFEEARRALRLLQERG